MFHGDYEAMKIRHLASFRYHQIAMLSQRQHQMLGYFLVIETIEAVYTNVFY
jgi:hypothetical protein